MVRAKQLILNGITVKIQNRVNYLNMVAALGMEIVSTLSMNVGLRADQKVTIFKFYEFRKTTHQFMSVLISVCQSFLSRIN